jgi:hypothetical protein
MSKREQAQELPVNALYRPPAASAPALHWEVTPLPIAGQ